ncbi:MAG: HypC/HybG/HupF family hydrogenase formation chaperone [Nitrospirae bacterium]|nr:HypC/HybG/HupF family hydrogenase formation chaperone [Nitrospirota bacterium]
MNPVTGEIVELYPDGWTNMAKVRVNGVFIRVPMLLLPEAQVGDHVLVEGGVAVAVVKAE